MGEASYTPLDGVWSIDRTFVDEGMRGRGVAAALIARIVDEARSAGVKLRPDCSYAVLAIERNSADRELLSEV